MPKTRIAAPNFGCCKLRQTKIQIGMWLKLLVQVLEAVRSLYRADSMFLCETKASSLWHMIMYLVTDEGKESNA